MNTKSSPHTCCVIEPDEVLYVRTGNNVRCETWHLTYAHDERYREGERSSYPNCSAHLLHHSMFCHGNSSIFDSVYHISIEINYKDANSFIIFYFVAINHFWGSHWSANK
jgi:hypothetical protein